MRRLLSIAVVASSLLGIGAAASASWLATGTGTTTAAAATLGAGGTSTAAITSRTETAPGAAVQIAWSATDDASGYAVERAAAGSVTSVASGSDCAPPVEGLTCTEAATPEGVWRYRVVPHRGAWTGTPGAWSTEVEVAPARPSDLRATPAAADTIDLSWTDNSLLAERTLTLQSGPSPSGPWTTLGPAPTGSTYHHTGLACDTTYHYRLRVEGQGLSSPWSTPAEATTEACATRRITGLTGASSGAGGTWNVAVTIHVGDGTAPVDGAEVRGHWSAYRGAPAPPTEVSCVTGTAGTCQLHLSAIPNGDPDTARFTVTGIDAPYAGAEANTHNRIDFVRQGNHITWTASP